MITYLLFRIAVFCLARLPWWVLYRLSDLLSFLFRIAGYRKLIVMQNLCDAFPDKTASEIARLCKAVYRNFFDVAFVEALKVFVAPLSEMKKRIRNTHPTKSILTDEYARGKSVVLVLGHYANWEWALSCQVDHHAICFYKPFKNRRIDQFIRKNRSRFGFHLESVYPPNPSHVFETYASQCAMFTLVADKQNLKPRDKNRSTMVDFLGKPTPFLLGPAAYAIKYDCLMIYVRIRRIRRGRYAVQYVPLHLDAPPNKPEALTRQWVALLEEDILADPSAWFWFWAANRQRQARL